MSVLDPKWGEKCINFTMICVNIDIYTTILVNYIVISLKIMTRRDLKPSTITCTTVF